MSFNPDICKQAREVIFSSKRSTTPHLPLTFNNIPVALTNSQKHLGMQLYKKLNFEEHLNKVESKVNKTRCYSQTSKWPSTIGISNNSF